MIYITEDKPVRLSGLSSLFIKFDFNQEIVDCLKRLEIYSYHKREHMWEVAAGHLAQVVDDLTYIDDITLKLYRDTKTTEHLIVKNSHNFKPFDHQIEAAEFALNRKDYEGFLLLDSPGLGKTGTAILMAEELREQKGLEHCLIICGINTLKSNWKKEIRKFSKYDYCNIGEQIKKSGKISYASVTERANQLKRHIEEFFVIINVEMLRNKEVIDAILSSDNKFDMIVVDEIHKCGIGSQQSNNLLKLGNCKHAIGMTGTLLTNSPMSAYIPLSWIGVEKAAKTNFQKQYCVFGGYGGHQIIGYKNIDILKQIIDSCSIRRTKDMLNIPPKTLVTEVVELDDRNKAFYEAVKDGVKDECDKIVLNPSNTMAMLLRLRQATSCPSALTSESIVATKLQRAVELTDDIVSQGEKVVIMCTFKESVKELAKMLTKYNPLIGTGDIPDQEVSANIDTFQQDPTRKVIICTQAKCGTGITLNAATYMICIDEPWTWGFFEQVQDRIHRVTNTKPVIIYSLICEHTADELVDQIVHTKKALGDYMIDDKVDADTQKILQNYLQDL